ncbi:MAG TPA: nuclear transport factor 2 family protein [Pseudonocardiaceae bacterium]|nr:nuclear transport factor 2 family protein [Pseudonocardiaceae bacterium]
MSHHDTVAELLAAWADAETRGDADQLAELLTDDFTAVGPLGFTLSKADWLGRHNGGLKYSDFHLDGVTVREYGDSAVVVATEQADGTFAGHPVPATLRATLVAVRTESGWRLAATHMSFVAGTPGAPPIPGRG